MNPQPNAARLRPEALTSLKDWGEENLDAEVLSGRFTSSTAEDTKLLHDERISFRQKHHMDGMIEFRTKDDVRFCISPPMAKQTAKGIVGPSGGEIVVPCTPLIMDRTIDFWFNYKLTVSKERKLKYLVRTPANGPHVDTSGDLENLDSDTASPSDAWTSTTNVLIGLCHNAVFFSDVYLENAAIAKLKHRFIRGFAHEMEIIEGCHKIYFKKVLSGMDAKLRKIFLAALVVNASNVVMGEYGHTWDMFTGEHP